MGGAVSRPAEVQALQGIQAAHARWAAANQELQTLTGLAADKQETPPIDALRADFEAQLEVTSAAQAFARTCPHTGPALDGLAAPAMVQAMFQIANAADDLPAEHTSLRRQFDEWLDLVARWTPAGGNHPPKRPSSTAHDDVLAAVDDWMEALFEREHDQLIERLVGDLPATKSIGVTPDGAIVERVHIQFPHNEADDTRDSKDAHDSWLARATRWLRSRSQRQ